MWAAWSSLWSIFLQRHKRAHPSPRTGTGSHKVVWPECLCPSKIPLLKPAVEMETVGGDQGWCGEGGALRTHLVASQEEEERVRTWRKGHEHTVGGWPLQAGNQVLAENQTGLALLLDSQPLELGETNFHCLSCPSVGPSRPRLNDTNGICEFYLSFPLTKLFPHRPSSAFSHWLYSVLLYILRNEAPRRVTLITASTAREDAARTSQGPVHPGVPWTEVSEAPMRPMLVQTHHHIFLLSITVCFPPVLLRQNTCSKVEV